MASTRCHSSHGQRKLRFMSNRHRGCCFVHDHPLRSRRYRKESHGGLDDAELHHILRRLLPCSAVATPRLRVVLPAPCCEAAHPLLLFIAGAHASRRFERLSELHAKKESARTAAPHSAGRASAKSTQWMLLAQVLQLLDAQGRRSRELEAHVRRALHVCSRQAVRRIGGPTRSGTAACQVLHPGRGRRALPAVSAQAAHASLGSAG